MLKALVSALFATLAQAAAPLDLVPQTRLDSDLRCLLGVYSLPAGGSVTITGTGGQARGLQYTFSNGKFGTLQADVNGTYVAPNIAVRFAPCRIGTVELTQGKVSQRGVHVRLIEKETSFISDGIKLHGKLILPPRGHAQSVAVWIDGSNNDPSTDDTIWQYELARRGIAVFVYDKRGTGASAGTLTSDFYARARDTVAAANEVRRLAPDIRKLGVIGGSQGGWVAPLAATMVNVDFVIAAFAMAEGPIAQDRELVELQLRQAGFDEPTFDEARMLTAITERIVRSNMRDGFADLDAFKVKYANAPWLKFIQPRSYTGLFLNFSSDQIKAVGPAMAQGLNFDFEPRPVIEAVKKRQLWLLGGSDTQAPNLATKAILQQIQRQRSNIDVVVFPKADHGLVEHIKEADGTSMTYSAKLFDVTANWIKGVKPSAKENFVIMPTAG